MFQSPSRPAGELGDLVRNASNHKGPWPKLSVWHGSADRTVEPANADEIVKQWLDVHRSAFGADVGATVDGYPRQVWWNADGETSSNPTPSPTWPTAPRLGSATTTSGTAPQGAFLIEAGISSSYHIANFFGLTEWIRRSKVASAARRLSGHQLQKTSCSAKLTGGRDAVAAPASRSAGSRRGALAADDTQSPSVEPAAVRPRRLAIDVGAVITRALTAAGPDEMRPCGSCRSPASWLECRLVRTHRRFCSDQ